MSVIVLGWLMVLSGIDIRSRRLPNQFVFPATIAAGAMALSNAHVASATVALSLPYLIVWYLGGCGGGDVKMAMGLGAIAADVGVSLVIVALAWVMTVGAFLCIRGHRQLPHGPMLAGAAALLCAL